MASVPPSHHAQRGSTSSRYTPRANCRSVLKRGHAADGHLGTVNLPLGDLGFEIFIQRWAADAERNGRHGRGCALSDNRRHFAAFLVGWFFLFGDVFNPFRLYRARVGVETPLPYIKPVWCVLSLSWVNETNSSIAHRLWLIPCR